MSAPDNHSRIGSILDHMLLHFEEDRRLLSVFFTFAIILSVLSVAASVTVWLVIYNLSPDSPLLGMAGHICTGAYILVPVCLILTIILTLCQHSAFRMSSIVLLNVVILWLAAFVFLLANSHVIDYIQTGSVPGTLLWFMISLILGFFLAVLPALIVACVAGIVYKILDLAVS